jgi:hypothetical protein
MTPTPQLLELTDRELSAVTGGFLPLLGLLGMGANLAGSIMGGIGKKKAAEAEQLSAQNAQAQQGQASPGGGAPASPSPAAAGTNLIAQRPSDSGGSCCCGASSSAS